MVHWNEARSCRSFFSKFQLSTWYLGGQRAMLCGRATGWVESRPKLLPLCFWSSLWRFESAWKRFVPQEGVQNLKSRKLYLEPKQTREDWDSIVWHMNHPGYRLVSQDIGAWWCPLPVSSATFINLSSVTRKVQAGVCGLGHQSLNKSFGGGVLELVFASVLLHSDLKLHDPTRCHVSAFPFDLSILRSSNAVLPFASTDFLPFQSVPLDAGGFGLGSNSRREF